MGYIVVLDDTWQRMGFLNDKNGRLKEFGTYKAAKNSALKGKKRIPRPFTIYVSCTEDTENDEPQYVQ